MLVWQATCDLEYVQKSNIDLKGWIFQEKWKERLFFCEVIVRLVCLICTQPVAVAKQDNIKRHYEMYADKYDKHTRQRRTEKVNELASA